MFYFILYFVWLFAFVVGGLGFEFCVFVAGWLTLNNDEIIACADHCSHAP